jgi:hypothetical protein
VGPACLPPLDIPSFTRPTPPVQIAYGFIALVDDLTSYDPLAMTLFDYRTDFVGDDAAWQRDVEERPTFMYTMPLGRLANGTHRVFFEETSLVRWLRDPFASLLRLPSRAMLSCPTRLNPPSPIYAPTPTPAHMSRWAGAGGVCPSPSASVGRSGVSSTWA